MRISPPSVGRQLQIDEESGSNHTHRPTAQTTAWVVLSVAFGIFVVMVIGAFVGAKYYYDTATEPRTARLSIEEGIVLFRDAVSSTLINAPNDFELREGDGLLVGQGARAAILLDDGSKVRLYSGSEMKIDGLRKSRFHRGSTTVSLGLDKGTARLEISPPQADSSEFLITSPYGYALLDRGNYGVEVSEGRTRISVRDGIATAYGKSG
ncbi:MAG TPA: FecR family protein, partial [Chloroflexota bacterium]|nr:FecR family protein [Chloroflexota bacterium]